MGHTPNRQHMRFAEIEIFLPDEVVATVWVTDSATPLRQFCFG